MYTCVVSTSSGSALIAGVVGGVVGVLLIIIIIVIVVIVLRKRKHLSINACDLLFLMRCVV